MEAHGGDADGGHGIHAEQRADPADAVGQGTAQGPHQAAAEDAGGGVVAGHHRLQAVLVMEVAGQGAGKAQEAAKGHAVEEHEPPAVLVVQRPTVVHQLLRCRPFRGVAGAEHEDHQGQDQRDQREAEHVGPAKGLGQRRGEEGGEHRAGVAGAGDAQGLALVLRGIPLGGQRQGDGEGRTGEAEEQAQHQGLLIAVHTVLPGHQQRQDHHHLAHDAGGLG